MFCCFFLCWTIKNQNSDAVSLRLHRFFWMPYIGWWPQKCCKRGRLLDMHHNICIACPCWLSFTNRRWPFTGSHFCFCVCPFHRNFSISAHFPALVVVCLLLLCVLLCQCSLFVPFGKKKQTKRKREICLQGPLINSLGWHLSYDALAGSSRRGDDSIAKARLSCVARESAQRLKKSVPNISGVEFFLFLLPL